MLEVQWLRRFLSFYFKMYSAWHRNLPLRLVPQLSNFLHHSILMTVFQHWKKKKENRQYLVRADSLPKQYPKEKEKGKKRDAVTRKHFLNGSEEITTSLQRGKKIRKKPQIELSVFRAITDYKLEMYRQQREPKKINWPARSALISAGRSLFSMNFFFFSC